MNPIKDKVNNLQDIQGKNSGIQPDNLVTAKTDIILKARDIDTDKVFNDLINKIKGYNPQLDGKLLAKAYDIAKKYHKNQIRKSGEPFIIHPLEVAGILADIELDQTSIISAILHDLIEDTEFTYEKVKKEFGGNVADIINGVTKLDKIIFNSREESNAIKDQLTSLLSVDSSMMPVENSYWSKPVQYKVYFYDDSGICKVYNNGNFEMEETFRYGDLHKDDWTSYNVVISDPTVVVTINAGPGRFRVKFLEFLPDIIRSSSHEWEGR